MRGSAKRTILICITTQASVDETERALGLARQRSASLEAAVGEAQVTVANSKEPCKKKLFVKMQNNAEATQEADASGSDGTVDQLFSEVEAARVCIITRKQEIEVFEFWNFEC